MKRHVLILIAQQFWKDTFKAKSIYVTLLIMAVLLSYAAYSGWKSYTVQNSIRLHYQEEARKSWENNPDKHPHRMAHFGSFAFRIKHPMAMFDFGMENFTGNAVFLEAHKQNTINFSEASFSTGLLRFGEISMAMLLQLLVPLIIFFLGFSSVAAERANGTLKVMLTQGAGWKEIVIGKSLGLMGLAMLFFIPVVVTLFLLVTIHGLPDKSDTLFRYSATVLAYMVFLQVLCFITVIVSAVSKSSKDTLMKLLAFWLVLFILLPKTTQAVGSYFYPSPSKIEFETDIEKELALVGDSHNPDDLHFKALRDSVLTAHEVDAVEKLPFNYSGFVMREGEKISALIYNRHLHSLLEKYQKQNELTRITAFINPYSAICQLSMSLAGTDFESYQFFQHQAESYRYQLAQKMNELQMEFISNSKLGPTDKPYAISHQHWKEFPDFTHQFVSAGIALQNERVPVAALAGWSVLSFLLIFYVSKNAKTV